MAAPDQIDELRHRFAVQPRRYFAPLADALRQAGAYEEAVVMLRAQLAEIPQHLTGHVVLGQALFDAGALADARAAFETARALDPGNRVVLRQLGEIASLGGDQATARMWFGRLRAADPYADDVAAQLGGAPGPPDADDGTTRDDEVRVERDREVTEPPATALAAPEAPAVEPLVSEPSHSERAEGVEDVEPPSEFELLEFDPVPPEPSALDPVVGLDLAPASAPARASEPESHDAGRDVLAAVAADDADESPSVDRIASGPFATETMAGLLAAQGHTDQAVALYERLTAERPDDVALRGRLDALRANADAVPSPPASSSDRDATPAPAPARVVDDVARGEMLATGFASLSERAETERADGTARPDSSAADASAVDLSDPADLSDPYADVSFDRFFASETGVPPNAYPDAAATPDAATPDSQADADADLARFDAWLRDVAA